MADLILHHYDLSPFSEKVRAMLGYAGLSWHSVKVEPMPPRAHLAALTGGYRKIPVAQIGADVFCDSRSIAREIARLADRPELIVEHQSEAVQAFVREVDLTVFLACVVSASGGRMLWKLVRSSSPVGAWKFLRDRIAMGRQAKVRAASPKKAPGIVRGHIRELETMLVQDYLFGEQPCVADFSAYHGLWFVSDLAGQPVLDDAPRVAAWMQRMRAFGHGQPRPMSVADSLAVAADAQPVAAANTDNDDRVGRQVTVAPDDYGLDPVAGTLVATTAHSWVLARKTPQTGLVHVHFPRQGFVLR